MLVLTRKVDESIIIGDNIKITVVDIRGDQAKIGIEAPLEISVHREEVYLEIQEENRRAAMLAQEVDLDKLSDLFRQAQGKKEE